MTFPGRRSVGNSVELRRILALPRRIQDGRELVAPFTEALKTPDGTQTLRPLQAQALHDLATVGGMFGPIRVGGGKTLVSLLAPLMCQAKRPVLLLPASLIRKTENERMELAKHWCIPTSTRLISYEILGRVKGADILEFYRPDLIIADETHRLKSPRAGVTRRVVRYMRAHPETRFVGMSGTVMKNSLRDFAHILRWCLKDKAPVPLDDETLSEWGDALDEKVNMFQRLDPGALVAFSGGDSSLGGVRRGFQSRLLSSPGVVGSSGDQVACSLYIEGHVYPVRPETEAAFKHLRETWETPDGFAFAEAADLWRHARELALGFWYRWDPPAPKDWLAARKAWAARCREILASSRTLDTELHVANAVDAGQVSAPELAEWRAVKKSFTPNTVAVWQDTSALEWCVQWMKKGPGIVWVEHQIFGKALSTASGRPYFGAGGVDGSLNPIEGASGSIIASIAANSTGRNLQKWHRNLITSCPMNAPIWEQLLGRTHREGQEADTVTADVLMGCSEHVNGFNRSVEAAKAQRDLLGHEQKILLADIVMPPTPLTGARWVTQ